MPGRRARSLNSNRDFVIFWLGQTFSVLGDAFALVAVPLLVLEATGSVARMGLVTATVGIGNFAAGLVAGPIVDRVDRRRLMIWCDLGRLVVYALIPLGWWLLGPSFWLLIAITLIAGALGMLFGVAYITAVANLVERDQIVEANGRLHATFALAYVLGPMLAGLVAARFGPTAAIGLNAVSFLASAGSLALIRLRRATARRADRPRGGYRRELLVGARFLAREPLFRALSLLMIAFAFVSTGALDLIIFHLKHDLGRTDRAVGLAFGLGSLGAIAGGILTPRLRRRWGFGPLFAGGFVLQGAALLGIGLSPGLWPVVPLAIGWSFGDSIRGIATMSVRQELVPDHLLGRVTAAFWMCFNVPGPLGAVALTALAATIGAPATLALVGALTLALAGLSWLTPARDRRPRLVTVLAGEEDADAAMAAPAPEPEPEAAVRV